jgi:DNA mismatch repair protein MutS2
MLQCGLSVPVSERSRMGIFQNIMIDIGDEQSIENDLSTYSSHLLNMKNMMRQANGHTLLLIDEFGGGTEPQIGGAIAEAVLKQFWKKGAFGIITTHYQNLKHFSEGHPGVVNGAMLYDRQQMQALFQLSIGQPGSSFAIEIARKTGIPEEVISDASEIVGRDYIQSDKYLQDIVRDKRYWEGKRQTIHQREKEMQRTIERYESDLTDIEQSRKAILRRAQEQAEEILSESNRRIESAIREIRESQAQKEETRRIREELESFRNDIKDLDTRAEDEKIAKKIAQLQARKERKEKRKKEKANQTATNADSVSTKPVEKPAEAELVVGQTVRIKGLQSIGKVESISGKMVTVIFGDMRTKMRMERLEPAAETKSKTEDRKESLNAYNISRETRETIDSHRQNFRQDLDVRGMRGDEALNAVTYFIDDAILMGMSRVRILHGKGDGILRQLIRQYLSTVPNVTHFADEHVQFGGTGITVVDF